MDRHLIPSHLSPMLAQEPGDLAFKACSSALKQVPNKQVGHSMKFTGDQKTFANPQDYSSDLSLASNEINVDVRAIAKTAQPTPKIKKSLFAITTAPKHEGSEAKDRWHPQPHVQTLLFAAGKPQRD